jgi:hypothetical protein
VEGTFSTFRAADRVTEEFGEPVLTSPVSMGNDLEENSAEVIELRDMPPSIEKGKRRE